MARRGSDHGSLAAIWLATAVVLVLGAAGTGFVIFIAVEQRETPFMIWGGTFAAIVLLLIVTNIRWEEPVNQLKFWLSFQERRNPTEDYSIARRSISSREKYGTNTPPSVDSVRDASNHGGAWVPRSQNDQRPPKKS